ncbi:MAG: N-6 DNA methylase, partial [candidate division WOR-3 bacterium]
IARDKKNGKFRDRRGETLFIDARELGRMVDRIHRELTEDDIQRIAGTYHAWRGRGQTYSDIPGFCKSATLEEIRRHGHILTPGRYVGVEPQPEDTEPFEKKMKRLTAELEQRFAESARLEKEILKNLKRLGYEG